MLKLTEEERLNLQKKFDAFTTFNETFTYSYSLMDSFFRKFSNKEILSEDFYPKMYNEIHKYHNYSTDYIRNILLDRSRRDQLNADFFSSLNLSEEEALKLADELISITNQSCLAGSLLQPYITIIENIILKYKETKEAVLLYLFDHNAFKYVDKEYLKAFIDNLVSKGTITDPIALIKLIQEKIPTYNNFPLIILNNNIDNETKIKAIKVSYRQKDLPQYKIYFRRNINDFDLVDIFLQATVIQNNRVKEKEAGLIDFIKKIFINGDESPLTNNELLHSKEFATKYLDYFRNENFMKKLYGETVQYMSTNTWRREQQYETFCVKLFKDFSFDEKIELATENMYLRIFKRVSETFKDACYDCDYEKVGKMAKMFISWYSRNHDIEKFYDNIGDSYQLDCVVKHHPDLIKEFFSEYVAYNTNTKDSCYRSSDIVLDAIRGSTTRGSSLLDKPELIESMKFFTPEDLKYFGLNFGVLKKRNDDRNCKSYNDIQGIVRADKAIFKLCLDALTSEKVEPEEKVKLAEIFKKTFNVKYFMNEENIALITDSIMCLNQDADLKHDNTGWRSGNPTAQLYLDIVTLFRSLITKMSELLNDESLMVIDSNFQDSEETIKLICALQ